MMQMNTFYWVIIFALAAMIVNGIGIYVVYLNREWAAKTKEYFMCFAAGMLITSSLIIAFPEALEKNKAAGLTAVAGFIYMFFSNRLIKHKTKQEELAFGITALQGIAIHSFIDGVIYSVTFKSSLAVGLIAGTGLVIHEFAEGIITFSVLTDSHVKAKKAFVISFIVSSLTTPLGAFIAWPIIQILSTPVLGLALGFVAGVLIYISASHLLPKASLHEKQHSYLAFVGGITLSLILFFIH